jgi:4,5-DOPA dioxygenase extradiol
MKKSNNPEGIPGTKKMPVLFVGHGNPMNAIEKNSFSETWKVLGKSLPKPKAILSISAHWLTYGETMITSMDMPRTIHDFGGFPKSLFEVKYPAPGSPRLAGEIVKILEKFSVKPDHQWGLDHGTWSVLLPMFPDFQIPVIQLSIDYLKPPQFHFDLARELRSLREKGILIMGSGNLVHNLGALSFSNNYDWAFEFDKKITEYLDNRDEKSIINFESLGKLANLAHPTTDHFLPLIYTIAQRDPDDILEYFNCSFDLGSISMRSFILKS